MSFLRVGFQTEDFEVVGTNGDKFSLDSTLPTDCDVAMRSTDPFAKYLVGPAYNGECLMLLTFHIPIVRSIMQGRPHKRWERSCLWAVLARMSPVRNSDKQLSTDLQSYSYWPVARYVFEMNMFQSCLHPLDTSSCFVGPQSDSDNQHPGLDLERCASRHMPSCYSRLFLSKAVQVV